MCISTVEDCCEIFTRSELIRQNLSRFPQRVRSELVANSGEELPLDVRQLRRNNGGIVTFNFHFLLLLLL